MAVSPQSPFLQDPPSRRLAPMLHILTPVDDETAQQLWEVARTNHRAGQPSDQTADDLTARALAMGYTATIEVREVASRELPSFPGEEVVAPVVLIDLRPLRPRPAKQRPK